MKAMISVLGAILAGCLAGCGGSSSSSSSSTSNTEFAYVVGPSTASVFGYMPNTSTGVLAPLSTASFTTGPAPTSVAVIPSKKFAYVADSGANEVQNFAIGPNPGVRTAAVTH